MPPFNSHQLTEQDRSRRIGELLCRAILRSLYVPSKDSVRGESQKEADPDAEQGIVNYLWSYGTAAPADGFQSVEEMSRSRHG